MVGLLREGLLQERLLWVGLLREGLLLVGLLLRVGLLPVQSMVGMCNIHGTSVGRTDCVSVAITAANASTFLACNACPSVKVGWCGSMIPITGAPTTEHDFVLADRHV